MTTTWDRKRALWYCRAIEQSNYPRNTVIALTHLLEECESIIDIGAGCGALSIPIARLVKKVTAIEPSKWMFNLLLKRAKEAGISNINAFNSGWLDNRFLGNLHSQLKAHDMVICANLPESVVCNIHFLKYISSISRKFIVYLQGIGAWDRFYYKRLYPLLFKKKYTCEGSFIKTYNFLFRHNIFAHVKIFDFYLDQPFKNFDDAMDFWRHRLKTKLTQEKEKTLAGFLKKKLVPALHRFPGTGSGNSIQTCSREKCRHNDVPNEQDTALVAPFGLRKAAIMWWNP